MKKIITSEYARNAQSALWETGRSSCVIGWGDFPLAPEGWRDEILKPGEEFTMPYEVLRRIAILESSGAHIRQIAVYHEEKPHTKRLEASKENFTEACKKAVYAVSKVLPVLGAIAQALVTILGIVVTVLFQLILLVLMTDPIVIVQLEDQSLLAIARWYE